MKEKLVSLIVPVYGVEKYIRKSLDTIKNQTYKNLEIYLIDDGSKDNSGKICDEYASIDPRFKAIHKENEGQSKARNIALKLIKGEYLMFIDSDDYMDLGAIEYCVKQIEKNQTDMVAFSFDLVYEGEKFDSNIKEIGFDDWERVDKNDFNYALFMHKYHHFIWGKLYKTALWEDIEFPIGQIYEDMAILHKIINRCVNGITTSSLKYYHYLQRSSSTSFQADDFKRFAWFAQAKMRFYKASLDYGLTKERCDKVLFYALNNALYLYNNDHNGIFGKEALEFITTYKKDIKDIKINMKRKVILFMIYYVRPIYNGLLTIKRKKEV